MKSNSVALITPHIIFEAGSSKHEEEHRLHSIGRTPFTTINMCRTFLSAGKLRVRRVASYCELLLASCTFVFDLPFMQSIICIASRGCRLIYVSVNSKPDHPPPPGDPRGFAPSHCPGVGFSPNFLCPGVRSFEIEKFSAVLKEKCRNFSICFKETGGSLKSGCRRLVLFHINFCKNSTCLLYL